MRPAIILAAGRGERWGGPKLFARWKGRNFLEMILEKVAAADLSPRAVVVAEESLARIHELPPGPEYVVNPQPEKGMISSILSGSRAFPDCDGIYLLPVDIPFFQADTLIRLSGRVAADPGAVHLPVYGNRGGHPLWIPNSLFPFLPAEDVDGGLRRIIDRSGLQVRTLAVEDEGILMNMNMPDKDGYAE